MAAKAKASRTQATAKKATRKKTAAKKTAAKKTAAKKTAAKKTAAKKTAAKKTAAKKTAAKKTAAKTKRVSAAVQIVRAIRAKALSLPEAREEFPWDHSVAKVRKKVFIFLDQDDHVGNEVRFSVKLPHSHEIALTLPFAAPTGYGLARSGWVSFAFTAADAPPPDMVEAWVVESYRAVAPKRLAAQVDPR